MAKAINIKSLFLGAALAFAGVLAGEGIARADESAIRAQCEDDAVADVDGCTAYGVSYEAAMADVLEGAGRGYNCEVIELRYGSFEAQCDEVALPEESRACSAWSGGFEADGLGETDIEGMYEACMVIALHTGSVR